MDEDGSWKQLGEDICGEAVSDFRGISVSLSGNGTTVAIGAPWNSDYGRYSGNVKVHRIDSEGSCWEQLGQIIYGETENDYFGWFVDITPDGNTMMIGSAGYITSNWPGYVRVYHLDSSDNLYSSWNRHGQDITGNATGDEFGSFGSLSDDGKTLAVGVRAYGARAVRVYRMDDSSFNWTQLGEDIGDVSASDHSVFCSLSLSKDGKMVAIGSFRNDGKEDDSGLVRVLAME